MAADPFYKSQPWRKARARHLRFNPTCAIQGCRNKATIVDHIVSRRADPRRELDPSNFQSLCFTHHNQITKAYDSGSLAGACDVDGNPLDPNHPWNQASQKEAIDAVNREPEPADPKLVARLKRQLMKRDYELDQDEDDDE